MEALDRLAEGQLQLRRRKPLTRLQVVMGMGAFLAVAEAYNGAVTASVQKAKRVLAALLSYAADGQSGFCLRTLKEPPPMERGCSWRLPNKRKEAEDSAAGTSPQASFTTGAAGKDRDDTPTGGAREDNRSHEAPTFFMSTKLFGCLDLEESQELYKVTNKVVLQPREVLFRAGDSGDAGIFIVMEGRLGVYLQDGDQQPPIHTNTLNEGESVGDLDVLDGARRSVTCMALDDGAVLLQVPRRVFLGFLASHPRALYLYLSQALARLWRVAHFVLVDFLNLPPCPSPLQPTTCPSSRPTASDGVDVSAALEVLSPSPSAPPTKDRDHPPLGTQPQCAASPFLGVPSAARQPLTLSNTFAELPKLDGPVCTRQHAKHFIYSTTADLAGGWDVVSVEDTMFSNHTWRVLSLPPGQNPALIKLLSHGDQINMESDAPCSCFYIVIQGHLLSERPSINRGSRPESAVVSPGSLVGGAAFLAHTPQHTVIRAAEPCVVVAVGQEALERLLVISQRAYLEVLLTAGKSLGPTIRRFLTLGLNRVWLRAGEYAFKQGEPANCLFINISGRMQSLHHEAPPRGDEQEQPAVVELEWGRGEVMGGLELAAGGVHQSSARAVRDCELVRMNQGAFRLILTQSITAVQSIARATVASVRGMRQKDRRLGGQNNVEDVVTIALMPAGDAPSGRALRPLDHSVAASNCAAKASETRPGRKSRTPTLTSNLCRNLKESLEVWGPVLHLNRESMQLTFPTAFERLRSLFYRSKITSWMAQQEEDYRFILLETDMEPSAWGELCVSQADCVLLVAAPDSNPEVGELEREVVWQAAGKVVRQLRIELVLSHTSDSPPCGTAKWLDCRPHLRRHHHVRFHNPKDMARLARWMAGRAVGLVLSGGGSRGLAHLGVLRALDDAGLEVDVVGGTSQGAFMAALYAQGLTWDLMLNQVRQYASRLGSVRHLMSDITLPLLSIFSGNGFDELVKEALAHGPQRIEDAWLQYFCITTNLNQGMASSHQRGDLATLVRASMTIVGLVPPVCYNGELHVDGGYLNNVPVAEMYAHGVGSCIVVDVEDKEGPWKSLQSYDGGVSGWKLLWDRWCPLPSLQFGYTMMPRYNQLINALTWMGHSQNIRRVRKECHIDLYLRPPGIQHYKLMDHGLMDRIVRDAYRYGWAAVTEWAVQQGLSQAEQGGGGASGQQGPPYSRGASTRLQRMQRAHSLACMSQLQKKQAWIIEDLTEGLGGGGDPLKTAAQASQRGDSDCSSSSGRTANSSSSEGDGAPESSGRSWWSLGRKEDTAAEEDNPPSQAGCSNVLPLYNIPESSSVQDHPAAVSHALTQNGRRRSWAGHQRPQQQSIAPAFAYSDFRAPVPAPSQPLGEGKGQEGGWRSAGAAMAMGRGQQPAAAIADVSFPMDLVVGARDFSLACGGAHNPQSER